MTQHQDEELFKPQFGREIIVSHSDFREELARQKRIEKAIRASDFWECTCQGIALWAVLYVVLAVVLQCIAFIIYEPAARALSLVFGTVLVGAVTSGYVWFFAMGISRIASWLVARSTQGISINRQNLTLAIFTGGLVGLLCPGLPLLPLWLDSPDWARVMSFFLLVLTTTVFGQIGAARGAITSIKGNDSYEVLHARAIPRFKISYLMWATLVAASILSVLKLLGIPMTDLFGFLGIWCAFQSLSLLVVRAFARRIKPPATKGRTTVGLAN